MILNKKLHTVKNKKVTINFQAPKEIDEKLRTDARKRDVSKSVVVRDILRAHYGQQVLATA
jgi:hypothetical protein